MSERNRLSNGRFLHDIDNWTASGAEYSAGDGDDHYGVAVLASGEYIEQTFTVPFTRVNVIHVSVKPETNDVSAGEVTLKITDGDGNTVTTINLSGTGDTWTDNSNSVGLASGTTFTIQIKNVSFSGDVKIDDVYIWPVPITREDIATQVNERLGRISTDRSLSTSDDGAGRTEGDYTFPINGALRDLGAINPITGDPDIRYVEENGVTAVLDLVFEKILDRIRSDYSVEYDVTAGPVKQSRSQIMAGLDRLAGGGDRGGSGRVVQKRLNYK